jgi:integrase
MRANLKDSGKSRKTKRRGDNFPLFQRGDGRWCKKIRGKHRYFGYDKAEALRKYEREIGLLSQGLEPANGDVGLRELFNRYLEAKQRGLHAGKVGMRTVSDSARTLRRAVSIMGDRLVSTLTPADFAGLNAQLSKGRTAITVSGHVRRLKAVFNWAHRDGLIPAVPKYGDEFKAAPVRVVRLAKSQRGALLFSAPELRTLIAASGPQMRAMIYVAANCALLPVDIARLEFEEIDPDFAWLRQARQKTGVDRLAALWPETAEALRAAIHERPKPSGPEYRELVFLTETGLPVVRSVTPAKAATDPRAALNANNISRPTRDFQALQRTCGLYRSGRGFNALRHGFLTIAEAGRDFPAVAKVMGHAIPGVSSHYREHIGDDRIKAACELVREWLFAPAGKKPKPR